MKNNAKLVFKTLALTLLTLTLMACTDDDDDDNVNLPETVVNIAADSGDFTILVAALEAAGLDSVLLDRDATFTVFAPNDAAFQELGQSTIDALLDDPDRLTDILLYHVIQGTQVEAVDAIAAAGSKQEMANGDEVALSLCGSDLCVNLSEVISEDLLAENGVVHVIDKVLIPPTEMGMPTDNIAETAIAAGSFTTLVQALQAANLVSTLENEAETFTVFAPTDAAFDLIPDATLTALLADTDALTNVLLQHVIIGSAVDSVTAFTLNGTSRNTAADEDVTIEIVDGVLEIQGSPVSMFDIYASNGVIHVIDAVITETLP
jgi:uncharacterized surface protein with fasciclin (FAS1) repeats